MTSQLLTEHSRKAIMLHVERKEGRRQMTNAIIVCLVERYRNTSYICAIVSDVRCLIALKAKPNIQSVSRLVGITAGGDFRSL